MDLKYRQVESEGVDTPVTIVSYSNFSDTDDFFLKEGEKIAVIAASALPSKAQIEAAEEGLEKWGYVPNDAKIENYIAKDDFNSPYFLSLYEEGNVILIALNRITE